MSSHIIEVPDTIRILLKRIENYTINKQYGEANIPHLCIKVRHSDGFAWFGLHVLTSNPANWNPLVKDQVESLIVDGLNKICDVQELETDMKRMSESVNDIVTSRKRPVLYGDYGNELINLHMESNVQIDAYRNQPNPETLTYGGFSGEVQLNGRWYPCFIYHRAVILYNYVDVATAEAMVQRALTRQFPELFEDSDNFVIIDTEVQRTRNKRRS